jgi:flagellar assembly protein FliH
MKKALLVWQVPLEVTMNTSARVYKSDSTFAAEAFLIPSLGEKFKPAVRMIDNLQEQVGEFQPEQSAEEILQSVKDEANQIILQAEKDREAIEQAAREKAELEARKMINDEIDAEIAEIREEFTETIRQLDALRDEIADRVEKDVVELAIEIAKKIVGREVAFDRDIALTLARVSLKKIHSRGLAEIHLHPDDFNYVQSQREKLNFRGSLEFIEDRSISVGGCFIHTETGDVDATIESQFAEISHGLLGK